MSSEKKLISFDVFDTAIFRKVYKPTDIFDLVEKKVDKNFKKLRLEAQDIARRRKRNYTLSDIYQALPQFDKKVELSVEEENCYANTEVLKIYNSGEYDCVFISDMYLSSYQIANLLIKCGYKNPKVYSSSSCNCQKSDGSLFEYVQKELNRKIFRHYGDNYNSDIMGSQKVGIKEQQFLPNVENTKTITPILSNSKVYKLHVLNELSNKPIFEKVGYMWGTPIYEFTKWILNKAKDNQTIYFNARDGYLPYLIAKDIIKTDKKIKYCYISRRSAVLPLIDTSVHINHPKNIRQFNLLRYARAEKLGDFLKSNRIDKYDYSKIYNILNITEKEEMSVLPFACNQQLYEKFIIAIEPIIYKRFEEDKKNFIRYLLNIGIKDNDIFVDIGYNGTMQFATEKALSCKLNGMYFQLLGNNANADYSSLKKESYLKTDILRGHCGFAETVFSEPAGGVTHYDENGNPVFYGDSKIRLDITQQMIKGALDCAKDMYENDLSLSEEDCRKLIGRLFVNPTDEECEAFNRPMFENGAIDKLESIVWYDRDKIIGGDFIGCYNRSYWKEAFIQLLHKDKELAYLETKSIPPDVTNVLTMVQVKKLMEKFRTYNKPFYFYGCSALASEIIRRFYWIKSNPYFKGFIDQRAYEIKTFCDKKVYTLEEVIKKDPKCEVYITLLYQNTVKQQIGKQLIPIFNIY